MVHLLLGFKFIKATKSLGPKFHRDCIHKFEIRMQKKKIDLIKMSNLKMLQNYVVESIVRSFFLKWNSYGIAAQNKNQLSSGFLLQMPTALASVLPGDSEFKCFRLKSFVDHFKSRVRN